MGEHSYSIEEKHLGPNPIEPPVVSVTADEQQTLLCLLNTASSTNSWQVRSPNSETQPKIFTSHDIPTLNSALPSRGVLSSEPIPVSTRIGSMDSDGLKDLCSKEFSGWYSSSNQNLMVSKEENGKVSLFELPSEFPRKVMSAPTCIPSSKEQYLRKEDPFQTTGSELSTIWRRGRKQKYAHLSADERKAIRAAQNREATRRSRERSRVRYEMMVEELSRLRKENAELWRTREIMIGLLKQHNLNIPSAVIEMHPSRSNMTVTKDLEDTSPCSDYNYGSFSYPFDDLPSRDVPVRSTVLQPHM